MKKIGEYIPKADMDDVMMSIRTVDDFKGVKSMKGGFGVLTCVFFSFTCG